ncbi:hypothetical protein RHECNPAF_470074 [Rhizobium etli CNPAF512]|nr:hypothetical protein RHECNPAF_470074 [Rhizobium etli CNPAF512]
MTRPRLPCMIPVILLSVMALEDERGVRPAEAEGVGESDIDLRIVDTLAHDRHAFEFGIELADMGALADETLLHHQQGIDRFLYAGRTERMAGQRFGRLDMRNPGAEYLADGADFLAVADRRRGAVRVDIVDVALHRGQRLAHAADGALARGCDHVVTIRGGAVADDFGVDLGAAGLGVLKLLEHQHAGAAGDDEAVAVDVIGARGAVGRVIVLGGHGAHGVEEIGHRPVEIFVAAGKHHVLLAPLDHLGGIADAVRRGRAGRRDRIIDAVNLEPGGECGGGGRRHRLRYGEGADALRAVVLDGDVGRFDQGAGGRTAGAHDDAGAFVLGVVLLFQTGISDRLFHGDMVPGAALRQEAHGAAIDQLGKFRRAELRAAPDLALEAVFGEIVGKGNTRLCLAQGFGDFGRVASDRGNDTQTRDNYPSHLIKPLLFSSAARNAVSGGLVFR